MRLSALAVCGVVAASAITAPASAATTDVLVTVGEGSPLEGATAEDDFTGPAQVYPQRAPEGSSTANGSVGDLLRLIGLQFSTATPTETAKLVTFIMGLVTQFAWLWGSLRTRRRLPQARSR